MSPNKRHSEKPTLTNTPSLETIKSLEEALHRAETRGSKEQLETLLAEGFVEFGSSGTVYDRTTIVDLLAKECAADRGDLGAMDYTLRSISHDAVLLTYKTVRSLKDGSKQSVLRSSIWKYDGLKWQMLFHQGTVSLNSPGFRGHPRVYISCCRSKLTGDSIPFLTCFRFGL